MKHLIQSFFFGLWYKKKYYFAYPFLFVFSVIYQCLFYLKKNTSSVYRSAIPIIGVGNIVVGGTGKTSLVIELVRFFQQKNISTVVLTRGYQAHTDTEVYILNSQEQTEQIQTDEPILIYQKTQVPVIITQDRVLGVNVIKNKFPDTQVIICDDALQHFRLKKDFSIVLFSQSLMLGNGFLLPLGPLREKLNAIKDYQLVIINTQNQCKLSPDLDKIKNYNSNISYINYQIDSVQDIQTQKIYTVTQFNELFKNTAIKAICALANNENFFYDLQISQIKVDITQGFADHHHYQLRDLDFEGILITSEKDAVKIKKWANKPLKYFTTQLKLNIDEQVYVQLEQFIQTKKIN